MMNKNIGFINEICSSDGKKITHRVCSFFINNNYMVELSIEKIDKFGVECIKIPIEHAQEIGLLNFNALKNYCK